MLQFSVPPGYRRTAPVRRPKLDEFTGLIEQWLGDDRRNGYLATRPFEHVLGEIHCRDPGTRFSHPGGVPAGPATEIQHVAAAYAAERLLESRQRIGVVGH